MVIAVCIGGSCRCGVAICRVDNCCAVVCVLEDTRGWLDGGFLSFSLVGLQEYNRGAGNTE